MLIKVTKAMVLVGMGSDKVILETEMPPSVYPHQASPTLQFEVTAGRVADYVRDYLHLDPEVIDKEDWHKRGSEAK